MTTQIGLETRQSRRAFGKSLPTIALAVSRLSASGRSAQFFRWTRLQVIVQQNKEGAAVRRRGWSDKKRVSYFAMQDSLTMLFSMATKFDVWMGEKHLTFFYSSGNTEPLTAQKVRICQILGISPQLARFSESHETVDAARLSPEPTFESDGRKFWLP